MLGYPSLIGGDSVLVVGSWLMVHLILKSSWEKFIAGVPFTILNVVAYRELSWLFFLERGREVVRWRVVCGVLLYVRKRVQQVEFVL